MIPLAIIFVILLAILTYFLLIMMDLRTLITQLKFINQHTTNQQLKVKTRNPVVVTLTQQINHMIAKQQATHQRSVQTQQQLDLAIHNISHDLRTPLTVASGYSQLLLTNENLAETEHQQVSKLNQNLQTLSKHLNLLLLYNRLLENRITITPKPSNLSKLLTQTCLNYYDALQQKQIMTDLKIEPNITWQLDEEATTRILQNILGNILDHGYQKATVELKHIDQGVQLTATNQLMTPIKNFDRLLDRFYTEDLSHREQNAGLGLYIIAELVRMQGGQVSLNTKDLQFQIQVTFKLADTEKDEA
ncbi:sensor histidine kinase [Secundilactobacillus mixtipabuli]|uniref:histidine kinase n=1 Tax=Secundilactobacillus mixtipabuli TaxID=1435342 RepID=A0A1Z5ID15_9LACO|nr:HAMP domain-containing sensor histidine kinase [Secundilactobacillus mixtipabuli]GAW99624.1 two-component system sensor histidine kinase [Secundilactobacillus mixtipabuli]